MLPGSAVDLAVTDECEQPFTSYLLLAFLTDARTRVALLVAPAVSGRAHRASGTWENHPDGGVRIVNWPKCPGGSDVTGWGACGFTVTLYASGCPEESMATHMEMHPEVTHSHQLKGERYAFLFLLFS